MTLKEFVEHYAFIALLGFATGGLFYWAMEGKTPVGSAWLCLIWLVVWFVCWIVLKVKTRVKLKKPWET